MVDSPVNKNYIIEELFPTTVYIADNCCDFLINDLTSSVRKEVEQYSLATDVFYVNSTHTAFKNLEGYPFSDFKKIINHHASIYLNKLGYDVIDETLKIHMWCNISEEGGFLFPHKHAGSILSGVYYIQCSEDDRIIFYNSLRLVSTTMSQANTNRYNSDCATYSCVPGTLMMWNSDLLHGNPRRNSKEEKIVISFNITFK